MLKKSRDLIIHINEGPCKINTILKKNYVNFRKKGLQKQ